VNDKLDLTQTTILEQADRYRDVLARTIDLMDDWAGSPFIRRATQAAYDNLPWPEREVLGQYVLTGSPWGGAIAGRFDTVRTERYRLLQQVPLLSDCNNRALALIMAAIKSESVPAGTVLGRQGASVTRFVIVQSGAVEKWIKAEKESQTPQPAQTDAAHSGPFWYGPASQGRLAGILRRGASLGSEAFLGGGAYTGTYRTAITTEILFLTIEECNNLMRAGVKLATQVGQMLAIRQLLGQMPLFASMGPQQLDGLAQKLGRQEAQPGEIIVRQGEARHHFYIIASGQVDVSAAAPDGQDRIALWRDVLVYRRSLHSHVPRHGGYGSANVG
jgi:CRP-like cAMP-binding protein